MEKDPDDPIIAPWSRSSRASARVIAWPIQSSAKRRHIGIWGAPCNGDTTKPASVGAASGASAARPKGGCDPNYAGACIPSPPPDLDCKDITARRFRVIGTDVHHFDVDHAGIMLDASIFDAPYATRAAIGVAVALLVGKAIGIPLGAFAALKTGLGRMPDGATWGQMIGVGILGGIGFTVSLFITDLAFGDPYMSEATKAGVLAASVLAAIVGAFVLARAARASDRAH